MAHYEVQKQAEDRWLIDAVFRDRATAIEDARLLVARSRWHPAVRVLKVEEHKSGFIERIIYNKPARIPRRRTSTTRRRALRMWALPQPAEPIMENRRDTPARPSARPAPRRAPVSLLLAAALAGAVLILQSGLLNRARDPWLFDRPEAQQPNPVRNPWSGQVSH